MKQIKSVTLLFLAAALMVACGGAPATSAPAAGKPAAAKPTPQPQAGSKKIDSQAQWDKISGDVAKAVGFVNYSYEAYELPADTKWADTLAYYDGQAANAGWGSTHGQVGDLDGGHFGVWKVTDGSSTAFFVLFQINSTDGKTPTYTLALLGN